MLDQNGIHDLIKCSHGHLKLNITTEGSKKLIVVFGPKGHFNNLFFLEKQLVELDENVLFFNSEKDNWFVESQSFLDDENVIRSAQKLEELIRSICILYGLKEIVILGYSMGAYGAIIYSSIMTFDIPQRILLFGPKVNLYSRRVKKVYEVPSNNKYKELYGIADSISELPDLKYKSFIFFYGEQDLLDAESIMFYQNLFQKKNNINYKIFSVLNSGHELFRSFKLVGLPKVLRLILSGSFPDEIKQGGMHKKLVSSDLAKLRKLQGKDRIDNLFLLVEKYPDFFQAYYEIGHYYYLKENIEKSLKYLLLAFNIFNADYRVNDLLFKIYMGLNKYADAIVHAGYRLKSKELLVNRGNKKADIFLKRMLEDIDSPVLNDDKVHGQRNKVIRPSFTVSMRLLWKEIKNTNKIYPTFLLDSKLLAYKFAEKLNLKTPKVYQSDISIDEVDFIPNSVLKPMFEDSGKGVILSMENENFRCIHSNRSFKGTDIARQYAKDLLKIKRVRVDSWLVEQLISSDSTSDIALDIKFYCFYGKVGLILETQRIPEVKRCWYDSNFNMVSTGKYSNVLFKGRAKRYLNELTELAVRVSLEIPAPFVRVDFLKLGSEVYIGEFTPIPGGYQYFNSWWDAYLGEMYNKAMVRLSMDVSEGKSFDKFCNLSLIGNNLIKSHKNARN